jgi:putative FmdB family regulatory protein
MPLYEYQCTKCREVCEVLQKAKDKPLDKCPKCGAPVIKLISSPAIQFKGTGWYITDYAKKSSAPAGTNAETKGEAKVDAKAESKSETQTEAKAGAGEAAKTKPDKSTS